MKRGNIVHTFKKKEKKDSGNYRSLSLASVPGKTMEKIFLKALLGDMENREVVGGNQHAFTVRKSCTTNLVAFYAEVG